MSSTNLRKRKLRSFLTIGGMAVGIALIIFLVSIGFGLQILVRNQITNVEALSILDVSKGESTLLKLDQTVVDSFQHIENVDNVSPSLSLSGQVVNGESITDVAIYGVIPSFLSIEGVKTSYGGEFSDLNAPEIIVTVTALNLIGLADYEVAINKDIQIKVLVPTKIEGTEEEDLVTKEVTTKIVGIISNDDELALAYMPMEYLIGLGFTPTYSTAKVQVLGDQENEFSVAKVQVTDQDKLPEVRAQIEAMGYQVDSVADTVGQIDQIFLVFQFIVFGFGAIAMFVASIGALNTLTVSLLERTREIGLMKSLGATSGDIYRLFLVEAIVIGMTGGVIGIIVGYGIGELSNYGINTLAGRLGGDSVDIFYTPLWFVGAVLGLIFFISLLTGFYPARRAAKINPLDALRYE